MIEDMLRALEGALRSQPLQVAALEEAMDLGHTEQSLPNGGGTDCDEGNILKEAPEHYPVLAGPEEVSFVESKEAEGEDNTGCAAGEADAAAGSLCLRPVLWANSAAGDSEGQLEQEQPLKRQRQRQRRARKEGRTQRQAEADLHEQKLEQSEGDAPTGESSRAMRAQDCGAALRHAAGAVRWRARWWHVGRDRGSPGREGRGAAVALRQPAAPLPLPPSRG